MSLCVVPTGADIILDFVGAPYWEKHGKCVAMDGRIVHLGFVSKQTKLMSNLVLDPSANI